MPLTSAHNRTASSRRCLTPISDSHSRAHSCTFMSAAFLQQAVAENSSKHTQLLNSLSELDGIPDALKEQTKLVDDIQSQLGECEDNVARLFEKIRKERRSADPGIIPGGLKFSQVFRGRKEKEREREREERNKRCVPFDLILFQENADHSIG